MSDRKHTGPVAGGDELRACLVLLGLEPPVTWSQIKAAYRERSRELHPDRNAAPDAAARMGELADAYRQLEGYVQGFRFAFSDEEYFTQRPRERIKRQFGSDSDTWRSEPRRRR